MSSSGSLPFFFVLLIVVLALLGIGMTFNVDRQKRLIRQFLESRNARAIKIAWRPLHFDGSNRAYWVEYEDHKGTRTGKWCRILEGSTVVWIEYL